MKVQEALKSAIETIENYGEFLSAVGVLIDTHKSTKTVELCKSALSDIEKCEPGLKVYQGEICYKSQADDQSYGMWCPVNFDTEHFFKEGTEFYTSPISKEWVGLTDMQITNIGMQHQSLHQVAYAISDELKQLNAEKG